MQKIAAVILLIAIPLLTNANEISPAKIAHQLNFVPLVGYSNFRGLLWGGEINYSYSLTPRWQWEAGGSAYSYAKDTSPAHVYYRLSTGLTYNFSEDLARSYYVGAGAGLADGQTFDYANDRNQRFFGYLKAGKHFALTNAGGASWSPEVVVNATHDAGEIQLKLLQFTFSF